MHASIPALQGVIDSPLRQLENSVFRVPVMPVFNQSAQRWESIIKIVAWVIKCHNLCVKSFTVCSLDFKQSIFDRGRCNQQLSLKAEQMTAETQQVLHFHFQNQFYPLHPGGRVIFVQE